MPAFSYYSHENLRALRGGAKGNDSFKPAKFSLCGVQGIKMTTPEQLQAWREEFYKAFPARPLSTSHQAVTDNDYIFAGYLRAKQETEQANKDVQRKLDAIEECLFQKHPSSEAKLLALRGLLND